MEVWQQIKWYLETADWQVIFRYGLLVGIGIGIAVATSLYNLIASL
jgi:hypothetical protein